MTDIRTLMNWVDLQAGWALGVGLVGLFVLHIRYARRDRALLQHAVMRVDTPVELETTPPVSFLIAAWNEADLIEAHIRSFQTLRYPNKQLVLCAGGKDETYAIARRCEGEEIIVIEQQPGEGKQRALRRCLEYATGSLIYLTDADCLLSDAVVEPLIAPLILGVETVTTGSSRPLPQQMNQPFILQQWFQELYIQNTWGEYTQGILGRNAALSHAALMASGAFQTDVPTGTDFFLAKMLLKHGNRIRFVRESAIPTFYTANFEDYRRQQTRWLKNLVVHGSHFGAHNEVLNGLTPTLIGIGMLVALPFGLLISPLMVVGWLLILIHMLLRRISYAVFGARLTRSPHLIRLLIGIPYFALVDLVVWASAGLHYLDAKRLTRW